MPRDYKKIGDSTVWSLAESALGCGYDKGSVEVNVVRKNERYEARFVIDDPRSSHPNGRPSAEGGNESEAIENLTRKVIDDEIRTSMRLLKARLPVDERRAMDRYAVLLLEADHTVILGSERDTVESIADDVQRRRYHEEIDDHVDTIKTDIKGGSIRTEREFDETFYEFGVSSEHDAFIALLYSKNSDAWKEHGGEPDFETMAAYAVQADVMDALRKEGIEPSEIKEVECARCGDVVVTSEDTEDCPKCGLNLDAVERDGVTVTQAGSEPEEVCDDCVIPEDAITILPRDHAFECVRCGDACVTPKEAPEPARVEREGFTCGAVDDTEESDICVKCLDTDLHLNPAAIDPGALFECVICKTAFKAPRPEENDEP